MNLLVCHFVISRNDWQSISMMFPLERSVADWRLRMERPISISWPWGCLPWVIDGKHRTLSDQYNQKPYRNRHLGSQSLEQIFAAASAQKKSKISRVYLHVQVSNVEAKRFYERHGFKETRYVLSWQISDMLWGSDRRNPVYMKVITRRSNPAMHGY